MSELKAVRLTAHAKQQAKLRGALDAEIEIAIRDSSWTNALRGKWQAKKIFDFNQRSPVNGQLYRYKTVEAIFADESEAFVVITVKVYYSNQDQAI